ncbi:MAG: DUF1269 domain-containing protein, partial [Frankia sp.]
MARTDSVFLFLGAYDSPAAAEVDYALVKELHDGGMVGSYDAAVVSKDLDGKVHVHKGETATRHGTWGGIAAGAVVGLLFPPAILGAAAVGGVAGGVAGHLWRGMSRSDLKELGETIDAGDAALIVVGESTIESALRKAELKA